AILLRGAVAGVCLLPPTLLMGATLPAIARWVETTPQGMAWLGFFYGGNIAGAVLGCLLAGFYLLRLYDMATATYAALALNGLVGPGRHGWRWALASCCSPRPSPGPPSWSPSRCRTGPSTRNSRTIPGFFSSSTWRVASGPCCRPPACGGQAFRWRWRQSPRAVRMRGGLWEGSMRPTRSAPSSARWLSACW